METFNVKDTDDIILSTVRIYDSKPIESILSYIPHHSYKPIRLFREHYSRDQFLYKPTHISMWKYINYKQRYLKVEEYSVDERLKKAFLDITTIDGYKWTQELSLQNYQT